MGTKEKITSLALDRAVDWISGDPEKNLPRIAAWLESLANQSLAPHAKAVREALENPGGNWRRYIVDLWRDIDNETLKSIFRNLGLNTGLTGAARREEAAAKYGCSIPMAVLMDPTSACNLSCTGCWASEYGGNLDLSWDEMDSVVRQGKELGCHFYLFSGGEPLIRKTDIIRLCESHADCQFLAFTNGTLVDEAFAGEMLRVKNFIPAISVEGFEEETDLRRGHGTFAKAVAAMRTLREHRLPFGMSCCYTSKNTHVIGSEEYFDWMVEQGAKFCWLFTYMPVGRDASPELMVSAEQREFMLRRVREFRETKPLFTLDFWNDGEYSQGCLAAGRRYLHINANGDMEPCAFIHYSDSNVREKTLPEALRSPFFTAYREGQPFNANHLRPCPLLDNPGALVRMVESSGAHSTDLADPEDVRNLTEKCREAAWNWAGAAERIRACADGCCGRINDKEAAGTE